MHNVKIEGVNVANVGRFDKSDPDSKVALNSTIMLNPDELAKIEAITEKTLVLGIDVGSEIPVVCPYKAKMNNV